MVTLLLCNVHFQSMVIVYVKRCPTCGEQYWSITFHRHETAKSVTEEGIKNISMVNKVFILTVFVFLAHGLHAQQTMCKDTCRTVSEQEKGKSVEPQDTTKFLACPVCKGLGTIGKDTICAGR